jgi:hypothetical protein
LSVLGLFDTFQGLFGTTKEKAQRQEILHRLFDISHDPDQLANSVLAILVGSTVELSLSKSYNQDAYWKYADAANSAYQRCESVDRLWACRGFEGARFVD